MNPFDQSRPASPEQNRSAHTTRSAQRRRRIKGASALGAVVLVPLGVTASVAGASAGAATVASPVHATKTSEPHGSQTVLTSSAETSYTVVWGNTLTWIAQRFGTTVAALAAQNDIANPNLIFVGQVLTIGDATTTSAAPAPVEAASTTPTSYTVQRGDTLSAIAQHFGTSVSALVADNGIENPDLIFAGQVLQLQGGSAAAAPAATTETTPAQVPATTGATAPAAATTSGTLLSTMSSSVQATFACLVEAESSGNPEAYNPAYQTMGLLQFVEGTWLDNGGAMYAPTPLSATSQQQMNIGVLTYEHDGWSPWEPDDPECF